jgi:hypothetical protein
MSTRTASFLAAILSLLAMIILAVLALIFEILVLNGASESQGGQAIGISLACLGAGTILLAVLAWKAVAFLVQKFNLKPALAVLLTVTLALLAGGTISILAIILSIPLAGIQ